MDVIEKKIQRERRIKYKVLRKFRQCRDIASKHLEESYPIKVVLNNVENEEELMLNIRFTTKKKIALLIYEWGKEREERRRMII